MITIDRANFTGLVLGCIEAKFCKLNVKQLARAQKATQYLYRSDTSKKSGNGKSMGNRKLKTHFDDGELGNLLFFLKNKFHRPYIEHPLA